MNQPDEELKDIPGYEGKYAISNTGNVWSHYYKKFLNNVVGNHGYVVTHLYSGGIRTQHSRHRLVATAFVDNPENYPIVNHKDGVKTNNHFKNLEWTTYSGNMLHARDTGLNNNHGESSHLAKLSQTEVEEIRELYITCNMTQREIAKIFNVKQTTISNIIRKISWAR